MADIFLGSLETPPKQYSDLVAEAFNYRGNPSSYLIHSLAFCFIIKLSSIILLIYTLSQACAGAINISMAFFCVCICEKEMLCACVPVDVLLQSKIKRARSVCIWVCAWVCEEFPGQISLLYLSMIKSKEFRSQIHSLSFTLAYTNSDLDKHAHIQNYSISTWDNRLNTVCGVQNYCICLLQEGSANKVMSVAKPLFVPMVVSLKLT